MRIIAFITEPRVIGQILKHLAAKGIDARSPPEARHNHRPAASDTASPPPAGALSLPPTLAAATTQARWRSLARQACRPRLRHPPFALLLAFSAAPGLRRLAQAPDRLHQGFDQARHGGIITQGEKGNSYPLTLAISTASGLRSFSHQLAGHQKQP
jgi:hypothetical protein